MGPYNMRGFCSKMNAKYVLYIRQLMKSILQNEIVSHRSYHEHQFLHYHEHLLHHWSDYYLHILYSVIINNEILVV